jgi:uncharacterized protein
MELSRYLKVYNYPNKSEKLVLVTTRCCAILELFEALWSRVRNKGELSDRELDILVPILQCRVRFFSLPEPWK